MGMENSSGRSSMNALLVLAAAALALRGAPQEKPQGSEFLDAEGFSTEDILPQQAIAEIRNDEAEMVITALEPDFPPETFLVSLDEEAGASDLGNNREPEPALPASTVLPPYRRKREPLRQVDATEGGMPPDEDFLTLFLRDPDKARRIMSEARRPERWTSCEEPQSPMSSRAPLSYRKPPVRPGFAYTKDGPGRPKKNG